VAAVRTVPPATLPLQAPLNPPAAVDAAFRTDVERGIATRLRLTPAAIGNQLRAESGATLLNLAKPLGLAQDQLGSLVSDSLRDATTRAAQAGRLTPDQAASDERYWTAQDDGSLVSEASFWFVHDLP
jgi:hypothetical protein